MLRCKTVMRQELVGGCDALVFYRKEVAWTVSRMDFNVRTLLALVAVSKDWQQLVLDEALWKASELSIHGCSCWKRLCPNACMFAKRSCTLIPGGGLDFAPPWLRKSEVQRFAGSLWQESRDFHGRYNMWWTDEDVRPVFSIRLDLWEAVCFMGNVTVALGQCEWTDPAAHVREIAEGMSSSMAVVRLHVSFGRVMHFECVSLRHRRKRVRGRRQVDFRGSGQNFTFLLSGPRVALFDCAHLCLCDDWRSGTWEPRATFCCVSSPVEGVPPSWPDGAGGRVRQMRPCFQEGFLVT